MGSPVTQIQSSQTSPPGGKGQVSAQHSLDFQPTDIQRPMGKGGRITYAGQTEQPKMGQPNQYPNTVGPWDNSTIGTQPVGKGKGA